MGKWKKLKKEFLSTLKPENRNLQRKWSNEVPTTIKTSSEHLGLKKLSKLVDYAQVRSFVYDLTDT